MTAAFTNQVQELLEQFTAIEGSAIPDYDNGELAYTPAIIATSNAAYRTIDEIAKSLIDARSSLTQAQLIGFLGKVVELGDSSSLAIEAAAVVRSQFDFSPNAREEATEAMGYLRNIVDGDGKKIIDTDNLPKNLNNRQETLATLLMEIFLDSSRQFQRGEDLINFKESSNGSLVESLSLPPRRVWQLGNWLGAIGHQIG